MMLLHTYVPAVYDMNAGIPWSLMFLTMALTGNVAKYAVPPSSRNGISNGCSPSLSGIRASAKLMATFSTVRAERPPA